MELDNYGSRNHDDGLISEFQDRQWERSQSRDLLGPHGMDITEHVLAEIIPVSSMSSKVEALPIPPTSSRTKAWIQVQSPLASAPKETSSSTLPRIFVPFPRHLSATDITYLRFRDALTLPSESLQVELLKVYVEYVHPSIPLLDLEEFLSSVKYGYDALDGQRGRGNEREYALKRQTPLLLFQAVMFAGVAFAPLKSLKDAGYQSREDAKQIFFARVRLCYDFDTCTDRQSIIQALLLMTLCPSSPDENKDAYHWLGLSISQSYSLGLNHGNGQHHSSIRKKRLGRRIWWITFIRDRTLALNSRGTMARPIRIRTDDCDVDMLSLTDFDLSEDVNDIEEEGGDEMRERQNALNVIREAKICWCSNNFSVTSFGVFCPQPKVDAKPQILVVPEPDYIREDHAIDPISYASSAPLVEEGAQSVYQLTHSSPSTSLHDEVTTPQLQHEAASKQRFERVTICEEELDGGFGVDGEYDDYLEYLRPLGQSLCAKEVEQNRPGDTWAFQSDFENNCVLEV